MKKDIILEKILNQFSKKLPKFSDGRIDYSTSDKAPVLNCFVKYKDKILLLKRSDKVRSYKGLWNSVSGYLDEFCPIEEKAYRELYEEVGINFGLIKQVHLGHPFTFEDININKTWIIFPVLVELNKKPIIKIDWEHVLYKWINPKDLKKFDTVPGLEKILNEVLK